MWNNDIVCVCVCVCVCAWRFTASTVLCCRPKTRTWRTPKTQTRAADDGAATAAVVRGATDTRQVLAVWGLPPAVWRTGHRGDTGDEWPTLDAPTLCRRRVEFRPSPICNRCVLPTPGRVMFQATGTEIRNTSKQRRRWRCSKSAKSFRGQKIVKPGQVTPESRTPRGLACPQWSDRLTLQLLHRLRDEKWKS